MCFGKNIGLNNMNWFAEIVIGKSNILFPEMLDLGTESNKNKGSKKYLFVIM